MISNNLIASLMKIEENFLDFYRSILILTIVGGIEEGYVSTKNIIDVTMFTGTWSTRANLRATFSC